MIFLKNAKKVVGVRKPCNSCVYVLSVHVCVTEAKAHRCST